MHGPAMAKQGIHLMSSYPLPWLMNPCIEYGTDVDERLARKFFDAYHNKGMENTTDIWSSTIENMATFTPSTTNE